MDLDSVRAFVAVAEARSINRAAHVLHLAQPSVTRQVQRLEATLGVQLLDRRARPVTVTPVGAQVLEHCRRILTVVDEVRAVSVGGAGPRGEIRFGAAHGLADVALARPADRLWRRCPRVTLRLMTGWSVDLLQQVRSGALDVAVVQLPLEMPPPTGVAGRQIGTESVVFVAPRAARLATRVEPAVLADVRWILNPEGCGFRSALQQTLQRASVPLRVGAEVHGFEPQLSLVARGAGLGLVPARVLARSPLRRRLRVFSVGGHHFRLGIWTVRGRPLASVLPAVAVLEEELAQAWRQRGARGRPPA